MEKPSNYYEISGFLARQLSPTPRLAAADIVQDVLTISSFSASLPETVHDLTFATPADDLAHMPP